jgi:hypothetical protein
VNAASAVVTDLGLYRRGIETAVACWTSYARAIPGPDVHRLPCVDVAVFTDGPEGDVFNNAVLAHGLDAQDRRDAVDALVTTYAEAGITSYTAWVHETDVVMLAELTGRGFVHQETTWAMGGLLDPATGASHADVEAGTWAEYLRVLALPPGLLERADPVTSTSRSVVSTVTRSPSAWRSTTTGTPASTTSAHWSARGAADWARRSSASCSATPRPGERVRRPCSRPGWPGGCTPARASATWAGSLS